MPNALLIITGMSLTLTSRVTTGFLSDDSLLIVNRVVTKMSPLNRYFPLVGLETRLSKARPYCYVLLLVVFVLVYAHMKISVICGF